MTPNRAHKRAARAIAAEKNIRYPEADVLADPTVVSSERPRPKEYTPSTDPNDPELGRLADELNARHIILAPGVVGSSTPRIEKMIDVINQEPGVGEKPESQELDPADMQRVRIVFARRYADLIGAGLEDKRTLDHLAASLSADPGLAAKVLAAAIPEVRKALDVGSSPGIAWAPFKNIVGTHLYHMLQITEAWGGAPSPVVLRAAAETLESELRLGVF